MGSSGKGKSSEHPEPPRNGKTARTRLSANDVNELLDDAISEKAGIELGLTYRGNGVWATDYCNRKRKVLRLFWINPLYATFEWGWRFDFIPMDKRGKLSHPRTDRQLDPHVLEVSDDFRNNTENRGKTTLHVCEAATGEVESTLEAMRKKCIDVFEFLLPTIKAYFDSTNSYQGIVDRIAAPSAYYRAINPTRGIARVYLVAFLGKKDEALKELEKMSFADERTRERHLENLRNL